LCVFLICFRKHVAYEYAKRGARLALVARRENRLKEVAGNAKLLGSPDVIAIPADVSRQDPKIANDSLSQPSTTLDDVSFS